MEAIGYLELCMWKKYIAAPGRVERYNSSDTQALRWLGAYSLIAINHFKLTGQHEGRRISSTVGNTGQTQNSTVKWVLASRLEAKP
jgi:hypothetical protein